MKRDTDPAYWPQHLRVIFEMIGRVTCGKRLYPETLECLPGNAEAIIPGHRTTVVHVKGDGPGRKGNFYEITVDGPRIVGQWMFRSGELEALASLIWSRRGHTEG